MIQSRLNAKAIQKAAEVLKAIGHEDRLRLIECLDKKKEWTVTELVLEVGLPQAQVSKHLAFLKGKGIVRSKAVGKFRYYSIVFANVIHVLNCMRRHS